MLAWLKKLVGGASNPPPTAPGAPYRIEESTDAGRTTRRRVFNCHTGPEWLVEELETSLEADGRLWQRRTWYYPWGPVRRERIQKGDESLLLCYFASGELRLRRQLKAGQLVEAYTCGPLAGGEYAEKPPQYPGGDDARVVLDIRRAFKYPALAKRNQEEGRVQVGFVVSATGAVTNIHIIDSVSPSIDEAALRAVATIGLRRWQPALQNRQAIAVAYTIPITCRLL